MTIKEKIIILLKVLILTHIALFIVNIPIAILEKLDIISKISMRTDLILNTLQIRNPGFKPYFILSTILIIPPLEEISCRLAQTSFRVNYFIISVPIIFAIFIMNLTGNIFWIPKSQLLFSVFFYVYILIISALIGSVLYLFRNKFNNIEEFWNKNPGLIIYAIAILFAVAHLNNLVFEDRDIIFMPLILFPFFVFGLSFGYLRIRLGLIYSIALHFIILVLKFGLTEISSILKAFTHQ